MKITDLAAYLIEGDGTHENYYAKVYADRLLMRVFNAPSLMAYLRNIAILDSREEGIQEGEYVFQLKFTKLPDETISQVKELIGLKDIRVVEFEESHTSCTGFEFSLTEEDLDFSKHEPGKQSSKYLPPSSRLRVQGSSS